MTDEDTTAGDILDSLPMAPEVLYLMLQIGMHPYFRDMILTNPLLMGGWHKVVGSDIKWPKELQDRIKSSNQSLYGMTNNFLDISNMLESRFGNKIASDYVKAYSEAFNITSHYRNNPNAFTTYLKKNLGKFNGTLQIGHLDQIIELLDLSDVEAKLFKLGVFQELYPAFSVFLELLMEVPETARQVWSILLSDKKEPLSSVDTIAAIQKIKDGTLQHLGVIDFRSITKAPSVSEKVFMLILDIRTDLLSVLVSPLTDSSDNANNSAPRVDPEELKLAQQLVSLGSDNKKPTSLMIWGAKAIDKISVAYKVINGRFGWVLNNTKKDGLLPMHVVLAQRLIQSVDASAILVIPEAAEVLGKNTIDVQFFGLNLKEEVDEQLSKSEKEMILNSPIDTVWIAHSVKRINQAAAASFMYHLEVKAGSRIERMNRIDNILSTLNLSDDTKRELSKFNSLTEKQLRNALDGSKVLPSELQESFILSAISASARALDLRAKDPIRKPVTKYSLEYIHTAGRMSPERLIKSLRHTNSGSMCFFGLPGTGKTQFAEYIATELEKPIIMKRGSDLLDKYVGETEKRIAAMFDEAEDESAILFLDEADSFLRNRSMSRESWEVTRVNELLQKMERFSGIFICATNLFAHLDTAALRRFTFKMEFLPLTEHQRVKMFVGETNMDATNIDLLEKITEELVMMRNITPGDFATVKRQANLMGETLTVDDWLTRLQLEVDLKAREILVSE